MNHKTARPYVPMAVVSIAFLLAGCNDDAKDRSGSREPPPASVVDSANGPGQPPVPPDQNNSGGTPNQPGTSAEVFFASKVQPNLTLCRTCHVPGGIADIGTGNPQRQNRFLLSINSEMDYANLKLSWSAMGSGVTSNPLLREPSLAQEAHTGGQPWPVNSQPYQSMQQLLNCWNDASQCNFDGASVEPPTPAQPLLASRRARSIQDEFCENQPDSAALPQDPRELVRPGVNQGKAVAFNAYWEDCTTPGNNDIQRPKTCGEYRARVEQGRELTLTGLSMKFGHWFSTPDHYHNLWRRWGLSERPADFDAQVRARYGLPEAPFRNPYPLPGENPRASNGGSGQLPLGLTQIKDASGQYNGNVSISCQICHGGAIDALAEKGLPGFVPGLGATTTDMQFLVSDLLIPLPIGINNSPGLTNAMGLSGLLISLLDPDSMGAYLGNAIAMQLPGASRGGGDTKMPPLWNASHRPRKFWDAGLSYDAARLDSAILNVSAALMRPLGDDKEYNKALRDKVEIDSINIQSYVDSLTSPPYPFEINQALAEQGAVLFHSKDLWANGANSDIPRPPSNGSCAGCHGAYSPRYVNDPSFLEDARLEGMAGYITPLEQIRTDSERLKSFTKPLLELMSTSWFSYPEGSPGYVSPESKTTEQERGDNGAVFRKPGTRAKGACSWQGHDPDDVRGYLAPPMYGVWATAPYLHNGSVPDLWTLLTPEERPAVWRRQLNEKVGDESSLATGSSAYDTERMGWKYESLICEDAPEDKAFLTCEPVDAKPSQTALADFLLKSLGKVDTLGYQVVQPLTRRAIERRKLFNTHNYGKDNSGHDFVRVLSDAEKRAIIEYLKTL